MARSPIQLLRYLIRLLSTSQHHLLWRLRTISASVWRFILFMCPHRFKTHRKTPPLDSNDTNPPKSTHIRSCVSDHSSDLICASHVPAVIHPASSGPYLHPSSVHASSNGSISITVEQYDLDDRSSTSQKSFQSQAPSSRSISRLSLPYAERPRQGQVSPHRSLQSLLQDAGLSPVASFGGECVSAGPSKIHPALECIVALDMLRYFRLVPVGPPMGKISIQPLESKLENVTAPHGWTRHIHPDGAPFFHHEKKRILTDCNLLNPEVYRKAQWYIDLIEDWIRAHNYDIPEDSELVLQILKDQKPCTAVSDDGYQCGYYYAHHSVRSLFWLETNDTGTIFDHRYKEDLVSRSHAQLGLSVSYWQHWDFFSNIQTVTPEILNELADTLISYLVDANGSIYSNAPFSVSEMQHYLAAVKEARKLLNTSRRGSPWFVGRLFCHIQNQRFVDYYGQYGARLTRDDSVHQTKLKRTWLIFLITPFLFNAPDIHLDNLGRVYIDGNVSINVFKEFIQKLHGEWQDFVINAAVLLAANVAFLAIQSVDNEKGDDYRSPAQIASYLSTVSSISSIVMGLLLTRQTRNKEKDSAFAAAHYLMRGKTEWFGHEPLAIMFSLPFVFLMYAMVFFMVAFSLLCFLEANKITRFIFGSFWVFCLIMISWTIYLNWEKPDGWDLWSAPYKIRDILRDCCSDLIRRLRKEELEAEDPESVVR